MGISGLLHHRHPSPRSLAPGVFPRFLLGRPSVTLNKYFHFHIIVGIRFSQFLHFWELFLVDLSTFIQSANSLIFHDRQKRKFRNGSFFQSHRTLVQFSKTPRNKTIYTSCLLEIISRESFKIETNSH